MEQAELWEVPKQGRLSLPIMGSWWSGITSRSKREVMFSISIEPAMYIPGPRYEMEEIPSAAMGGRRKRCDLLSWTCRGIDNLKII